MLVTLRAQRVEELPTHFQSCAVIPGNKILMPSSKSTLECPARDRKWSLSCI